MARATDPPLYKRGDSPYWWTWVYRGKRRIRASTKCTDRKAALLRAAELQRAAAAPGSEHANRTVADALLAYLAAPADRAPLTVQAYGQRAVAVARIIGPVPLAELRPDAIERYLRERAGGARTKQLELGLLWMALKAARRRGWPAPTREEIELPIPGTIEPKTRWLTDSEVERLCDALPQARASWVRIACWTGARRAELNGMDWTDIDLDQRTLLIRGTKTGRSRRTIPLAGPLLGWLRARVVKEGPLLKRWPLPGITLDRACERAKIPRCTAHDFRRTFASRLKQRGVDSMVVARLLGHSTSRLVDTTYGHLDLETLRAAMALP